MLRDDFRFWAAGHLGSALIRGLGSSLKIRVEGDAPLHEFRRAGQPVIFVFWHSRILPLTYLHRNQDVLVLISEHGDGEYIARTIEQMGFRTARGSSTRGGARGLRTLVKAARKGSDLAFTPDGPRGPPKKFKIGALVAAQLTEAAVLPLTAGGESMWRVDSWDRLVIPKPFTHWTLKYGEPRFIPRNATPEELEMHASELEQILNRIQDDVDGRTVAPEREPSVPSSDGRTDPGG